MVKTINHMTVGSHRRLAVIELGRGGEELVSASAEGIAAVRGKVATLLETVKVRKRQVYRPCHHLDNMKADAIGLVMKLC